MHRRALSAAAALAACVATGGAAQPLDRDSRVLVERIVAGFRMQSIMESDGGRLVRMRRSGRGYAFEYSLEFWRGNGGVVIGARLRRGACRSGDADAIQPTDDAMAPAALDSRLGEYLRECPLTRMREAELRRSVSAAWPAFSALAQTALAATIAENRAIENYGKQD
jgi:hypothetical protein